MSSGGHNKKTQQSHKQSGTYRPSRHGRGNLPVVIPPMPADMPPAAEAVWKSLASKLEAAKLLAELDGTALRLLCESVYVYTESTDEVRQRGVTIEEVTKQGITRKVNPAVRVRDSAWQQIVKLCQQFGMTPTARTGFDFEQVVDSDDGAAQILGFKVTG